VIIDRSVGAAPSDSAASPAAAPASLDVAPAVADAPVVDGAAVDERPPGKPVSGNPAVVDSWWDLIRAARMVVGDPTDGAAVAAALTGLLSALEPDDIAEFAQPLWTALAASYTTDLWGAAYLINGGCSDDGFDYFRGWLMSQGRAAYERAVAEPDSLAELPAVIRAATDGLELEAEDMLGAVWSAYRRVTGEDLPAGYLTILYPELEPFWDFEDEEQIAARLPRLHRLYSSTFVM
jgi:Protein of unknown function (DUF4240)